MDVRARLIRFLCRPTSDDRAFTLVDIDADADLFHLGVLDSLRVIELILFLDHELAIKLESNDLRRENLDSLRHLLELVERKVLRANAERDAPNKACAE
jgi:acyl carrier protein